MQRLLDAVGSRQGDASGQEQREQQQEQASVGGEMLNRDRRAADAEKAGAAGHAAVAGADSSVATSTTPDKIAPPAATTSHPPPAASEDPDPSAFVVLSEPSSTGDNNFTVYSAEQLGLGADDNNMASSSDNPNGAPQINFPPSEAEMKSRDGPRMGDLKSSRAYSVSSPAADKSRRAPLQADNPSRIPSAGGQALGHRATQEREYRRKSRMSMDMGIPLDKEGSPDALTANNTEANTIPARMKEDNGEGSSKMTPAEPDLHREKSPSAPEVTSPPVAAEAPKDSGMPMANGQNDNVPVQLVIRQGPATTVDIPPAAGSGSTPAATAPDTLSPPATAEDTPAETDGTADKAAQKERRGSKLGNMFAKLKGDKKK